MKTLAVALFVFVFTSSVAEAARYKLLDVCKFDIEQYCKQFKIKTQKKQIKECLAQQQQNLLPNCQDHYKEAK